MNISRKSTGFRTPSRTSPKGGSRGCICDDNTYHKDCCDGSIMAQGIGIIQSATIIEPYILREDGGYLLQEDNYRIITDI